ncbi:hypothetical protein GCM10027073_06480 [Streptomyces chlorus]
MTYGPFAARAWSYWGAAASAVRRNAEGHSAGVPDDTAEVGRVPESPWGGDLADRPVP